MAKSRGKISWYLERFQGKNHPRSLRYNSDGSWTKIKEIIRKFGETQRRLLPTEDCFRYYPVLNKGPKKVAADFKFCYEEIREHVRDSSGEDAWLKLYTDFEFNRVNELYESVSINPNAPRLHDISLDVLFNPDLSPSAFRVLCAYKARSKRMPQHGGARVCGWSVQNLSARIGLSRNTVAACIKKLVELKYLTPITPKPPNQRHRTYKVNL